jgi:anion-transporting  ArsA/GET3 family ATPase
VVDTPPSRHALDFLDAPKRMADFFSSRLLRWLIVPYRSRVMNLASKPFYQVADRLLGTQFLEDIAEFFILFNTLHDGFVQRAEAVGRLLEDRRTTFVVVSTLEAAPLHEAELLADALIGRRLHLGALVFNKILPDYLRDPGAADVARVLSERAGEIAGQLPTDPAMTERLLVEIAESFLNLRIVARREAEQQADLGVTPDVVTSAPAFDTDIADMTGLLRLGRSLWG